MSTNPDLATYRFAIESTYHQQEHVLDEKGELLLSLSSRLGDVPHDIHSMLVERRHQASGHHAARRQAGDAHLRPVQRAAADQSPSAGSRGRIRGVPRHVCRKCEYVCRRLQRRAAARLVHRAGAPVHEHARGGASRQRHSAGGRRESGGDGEGRHRAAASISPPAQTGARPRDLPRVRPARSADRLRSQVRVLESDRRDRRVHEAARLGLSAERPAGVRRALDRRVRESRQAQRRVFGARVRRASVHAAELQRHARLGVYAGARDGALDAHDAVGGPSAVRVLRLHDFRRRSAVDAERDAVLRSHAVAHDRSARAHRAAAARHRRHRRHVLPAVPVRGLRAAGPSPGRAGRADHGRGVEPRVLRSVQGVSRRRDDLRRLGADYVGARAAFLREPVLRLSVRDLLCLVRAADSDDYVGQRRRAARRGRAVPRAAARRRQRLSDEPAQARGRGPEHAGTGRGGRQAARQARHAARTGNRACNQGSPQCR